MLRGFCGRSGGLRAVEGTGKCLLIQLLKLCLLSTLCARRGGGKTCAFKELALQHLQYIGGNKMHFREAVQCVQQKE